MCQGWSRDARGTGTQQLPPASPLSSHVDLAVPELVQEALEQQSPLDGKGHHQDADGHSARSIRAEEGHQEAKAKKSLEVDIPEPWRRRGSRMGLKAAGAGSRPPARWSP